jgi:magnesium transporter
VLGRTGDRHSWLRLAPDGSTSTLHLDKHEVARRCAVPLRDLRLLESGLTTSFATSLLSRERALVVNLENVKLLVTAEEALVPNPELPHMAAFARSLANTLSGADGAAAHSESPFEFRVLEAALVTACSEVEVRVVELQREAEVSLDELQKHADAVSLENVRELKSRIQQTFASAQALRSELTSAFSPACILTRTPDARTAAQD